MFLEKFVKYWGWFGSGSFVIIVSLLFYFYLEKWWSESILLLLICLTFGILLALTGLLKLLGETPEEKSSESSWLSEDGKKVEEPILLKIYDIYSKEQISHLDFHYKYRNYHITILSALLTIFVGGMLNYYEEPFAPALIVILLLIVILSEFGKRTIDRYYRRFLESVTILGKTQNALGLDTGIKIDFKPKKILWTDDEQIIPNRWTSDRKECKSSKEFISKRMKMGDNQHAHWTFTSFEIVSVILALFSIVIFLQVHDLFQFV